MDNKTVLLVEDNEELNEINRRVLISQGYDVLAAKTLDEARKYLAGYSPEVILLDVNLPDGDGIAFCDEIRASIDAHFYCFSRKMKEELSARRFFTVRCGGSRCRGTKTPFRLRFLSYEKN